MKILALSMPAIMLLAGGSRDLLSAFAGKRLDAYGLGDRNPRAQAQGAARGEIRVRMARFQIGFTGRSRPRPA
jgi:hypothetical protein